MPPALHYAYSLPGVGLSVAIAILASFTALDLAGRVQAAAGRAKTLWIAGGALALGSGIWGMHFVGMLALVLPTTVTYHALPVAASVCVAVGASAFALWVAGRARVGMTHLLTASLALGGAIAGMHYIGMSAMEIDAHVTYNGLMVSASVAIAVVASFVALLLARRLGATEGARVNARRAAASIAMGVAIAGMHYTGMRAAHFFPFASASNVAGGIPSAGLTIAIASAALLIAGIAMLAAMLDRAIRTRALEAKLAAAKVVEDSLRRQAIVFEAISDSVLFIDPNGRIVDANPAATTIYGYTREEMVGNTPALWARDGQSPKAEIDAGIAKHGYWEGELSFVRKNGQFGIAHTIVRAFYGADHKLLSTMGVSRDLTATRQLEQQLRQAHKLEAIGSLAAGMAHEINTPTQYVGDNLRFLAESVATFRALYGQTSTVVDAARIHDDIAPLAASLDETVERLEISYLFDECPRAAEQALHGVDRISELVGAMKEFAHPGTTEKVAIDLNAAIHTTAVVCRNEWKGIAELTFDLDPTLALVHCLPGELQQVILNLLVNAAHAIADNPQRRADELGSITVSSGERDGFIEVRVSDSGVGIPPSIQDKVFDPFFTTKAPGHGTGQGLAISHNTIAVRHNGSLTFETAQGVGTTFLIRLPLYFPHDELAAA